MTQNDNAKAHLNEVDAFGEADRITYPNPVLVERSVYTLLSLCSKHDVPLDDPEAMQAASDNTVFMTKLDDAIKWCASKHEDLLEALNGRGFEIKRFRVKLEFLNNPDVIMVEDEDRSVVLGFANQMKESFIERGFITKTEEDKSIGVYRSEPDPATGGKILKLFTKMRVSAISPRDRTPIQLQRYPTPDERRRSAKPTV